MKSNKIEHSKHLEESIEYILEHKSGWTQFTTWAREKYHINNRQANDLWKASWVVISENVAQERASRKDYYMNEIERIKIQAEADEKWGDAIRAVQTQIKLDGLDIQQIEAKIEGNINLKWGNDE